MWADDVENRRSQTGYAFLLNGAAISLCSKQQREIAKSSSDAEFRAYNSAGCEALFLRKLMHDFTDRTQHRNATTSPPPTTIYSDNNTAIKWLKNQSHPVTPGWSPLRGVNSPIAKRGGPSHTWARSYQRATPLAITRRPVVHSAL